MSEDGNARLHPSRFSSRYWILTLLRKHLMNLVGEYLSGRQNLVIVDFGCGTMPYKPIFEGIATDYIGIDLPTDPGSLTMSEPKSLPDRFADVVLSTQVLEHVDSPEDYLSECYRILKDDGLLILSTHGYWMYHPNPKDLWRWTGEGLRTLMTHCKLNAIRFEGMMGLMASGLQLLQDGMVQKLPKPMQGILAFFMQLMIQITDTLQSPGRKMQDACVFIAVAQKVHHE